MLLLGSDVRFAFYFYSMHRALRCRKALEATVHSVAWESLKNQKAFITRAVDDVKNDIFWKRIFVLLRALYPLLLMLRLADSNKPNMDRVCFLLEKARTHLIKAKDDLMDEFLFPTTYRCSKTTEADANFDSDEEEEEEEDDDDSSLDEEEDEDVYEVEDSWGTLYTDESGGIYKKVVDVVIKRTPKITHDFAITAWVCSVHPDIVRDAEARLTGDHRLAIERCVRKLLSHDVDGEVDGTIDRKIDLFWDELKHFQNR